MAQTTVTSPKKRTVADLSRLAISAVAQTTVTSTRLEVESEILWPILPRRYIYPDVAQIAVTSSSARSSFESCPASSDAVMGRALTYRF